MLPAKIDPVFVPISEIIRGDALQMRVGKHDSDHKARLRDHLLTGGKFDPCEVVSDGKMKWLTDGNLRVEILDEEDRGQVECIITRGTYLDARIKALGANSKHGQNRSYDDMRKAIATLIKSPDLLKAVQDSSRDRGGLHRGIAATCGVSAHFVDTVLAEHGLHVHMGRLAPRPPKAPPPPPVPGEQNPTPAPSFPRNTGRPDLPEDDEEPDDLTEPVFREPLPKDPPKPPPTPEELADGHIWQVEEFCILTQEVLVLLLAGPRGERLRKAAGKAGIPFPKDDPGGWKPLAQIRSVVAGAKR